MPDLPKSINAEATVISAMMLEDPVVCGKACGMLEEIDFVDRRHKIIFSIINEMYKNNSAIDLLTVIEKLQNTQKVEDAGGAIYINEISDLVMSGAHVEEHIKILLDKSRLRQAIQVSKQIIQQCYNKPDNPNEIINNAQSMFMKISRTTKDKFFVDPEKSNMNTLKEIEETMQGKFSIIKTDIPELDEYLQLRAGTLINIKADTSVGKSVLGMQIAFTNISNRNKIGLIVSGEMTDSEILMREYARQTGIPAWRIFKGKLTEDEIIKIHDIAEHLSKCRYQIAVGSLNMQGIRQRAQQVYQRYKNLDFIVIDYLQQMIPDKAEKREQEIAGLSRGCKALAMEFSCPVIEMTQVNSEGQARESRGIEQDTDIEIYLRRPFKEGFKTFTKLNGEEVTPTEQDAFVKITKNRKGKLGTIELNFNGDRQMFTSTNGGCL